MDIAGNLTGGQGRTEESVRMSRVNILAEGKANSKDLFTKARACLVCLRKSRKDGVAEAQRMRSENRIM